jgi:hypothetical protein
MRSETNLEQLDLHRNPTVHMHITMRDGETERKLTPDEYNSVMRRAFSDVPHDHIAQTYAKGFLVPLAKLQVVMLHIGVTWVAQFKRMGMHPVYSMELLFNATPRTRGLMVMLLPAYEYENVSDKDKASHILDWLDNMISDLSKRATKE